MRYIYLSSLLVALISFQPLSYASICPNLAQATEENRKYKRTYYLSWNSGEYVPCKLYSANGGISMLARLGDPMYDCSGKIFSKYFAYVFTAKGYRFQTYKKRVSALTPSECRQSATGYTYKSSTIAIFSIEKSDDTFSIKEVTEQSGDIRKIEF